MKGQKLRELNLYEDIGAVVLALRRGGELQREDLGEVSLSGGDSLLLSLEKDRLPNLKQNRSFVMVSEVGLPSYRRKRMPLAVGILVTVVLLAALNVLPLVAAAIAGAATLVLTRCVTSEEAVDAINWKVIFLLGGLLPLGVAMNETGAAETVAGQLLRLLEPWGQRAVLAGFFLFAVVLANLIGNQSTAALMAPIVLQAAHSMGVNPRTLLVAVTFAASLSFLSPVSYQTNTMVYGPGNYKFTDFTRVGLPMNLLFWAICTALIPVFWPF
jgi:di/tricarboxylate transporter